MRLHQPRLEIVRLVMGVSRLCERHDRDVNAAINIREIAIDK